MNTADARKLGESEQRIINAINSWNRVAIATGMFPGCFDN